MTLSGLDDYELIEMNDIQDIMGIVSINGTSDNEILYELSDQSSTSSDEGKVY